MIVKAYIKIFLFHLPMRDSDLLERVEEALGKKVNKDNFEKLYPLTKVEGNDNIVIEKQNTNIFLLNLLLWVLNHKGKEIDQREYYNKDLMINKLEEETQLELQGLPFDVLEKQIHNYLASTLDTPEEVMGGHQEGGGKEEEFSYLENVQFNVDWLKKAQKELNRRE